MDLRRRGVLLFLSLFTILAVVGAGEQYIAPAQPVLAQDAGEEQFLDHFPKSLYAGDPSHGQPPQADPSLGKLIGYCVQVQSSTRQSVGPNLGFGVDGGTIPVFLGGPNPVKFDNGTEQTNDDIYCIVVQADDDPDTTLLRVTWNYEDTEFGGIFSTNIEVPIRRVTLVGIDGVVGAAGTVCTQGWDPTILTGNSINDDGADNDRVDVVDISDWTVTSATNPQPEIGRTFKNDQGEWCISVRANSATFDIDVELRFDAVYDVTTDLDDRWESLAEYHTAFAADVVNINEVWYSELRHMTIAGTVSPSQSASFNVASSRHTACIIPSNAGDTFRAEDIVFLPAQGEEALPDVSQLVLFNSTEDIFPDLDPGTWCFSWTSHTPGEQAIYLTFTKNDGQFPGERFVSWDSNGDGNPNSDGVPTGPSNGALVKKWNRITRTEITRGNDPNENIVTNGTITANMVLAVSNGNYVFAGGPLVLTEWVYGSHRAPNGEIEEGLLDGAILVARVNGFCGYFVAENETSLGLGKVINGVSVGGRFDRTQEKLGPSDQFPWSQVQPDVQSPPEELGDGPDDIFLSITNNPGCLPGTNIQVQIDAYYPSALVGGEPVLAHTELLTVRLTYQVNQKTPRLAWAGQVISITYGFAVGTGGCGAANEEIVFIKQAEAPGNFLEDPGWVIVGNNEAHTILGEDCSATVRYESEQEGEIDLEAFLVSSPFSKIAYPIFYMALDTITMSASSEQIVSAFGDVTAQIKGYFVGANPSGRPQETTTDGRVLPANRWVIPDDWDRLKGIDEFRQNWPSPNLPPTIVTFFMANESIVNSYTQRVFNGAAGHFVLDGDDEISINVNPRTGEESVLGSLFQPRIITDITDGSGVATVDSFGDFNLGYNECATNAPTGNPHCNLGDIVGQTQFYAIADYPDFHGQLPPAISPSAQTAWTWAGYKTVSVEDSNVPTQKYVVVRMRDRDGFCDAINPNNVLGIPVTFRIDAGDGILIDYKGEPVSVDVDSRGATVTSFDTQDDNGNPMNVEILRPIESDTGDECQAWIKISRSLPGVVNVEITIPSIPAPPPSDVRFTGIQCNGNETITVRNFGAVPVSLEGYAFHAPKSNGEWAHLGLTGVLQPGQSKTFAGGPGSTANGWINGSDTILNDIGSAFVGHVYLVWDNREMGFIACPLSADLPPYIEWASPVPDELPPSGEGEIQLSVNVPFGNTVVQNLVAGWNLIGGSTAITPVREALTGHEDKVDTIYAWDNASGTWKRYFTAGPEYLNTLESLEPGVAYWVFAKQAFALAIPE